MMKTRKIKGRTVFVVEDDRKISAILEDYLRSAGHEPQSFYDGRSVVDRVRKDEPAAVILDIMLPASDGLTICKKLREFSAVPVLMLTAKVEEIDKISGLAFGADDYVTKPFSAQEVIARVNAMIRRAEGRITNNPAGHVYLVDEAGQRVAWHGEWLDLSPSEFRILAAMMKRPGQVFSRDQLLDALGDHALDSGDRAIDSHIKNIRRKIVAVDNKARCIASVYGSGYRFEPD